MADENGQRWMQRINASWPDGDERLAFVGSYLYNDLQDDLRAMGLRRDYLQLFNHLFVISVGGEIVCAAGSECTRPDLPKDEPFEIFYLDGVGFSPHVDLYEWAYPDGFVNTWDDDNLGMTLREWAIANR